MRSQKASSAAAWPTTAADSCARERQRYSRRLQAQGLLHACFAGRRQKEGLLSWRPRQESEALPRRARAPRTCSKWCWCRASSTWPTSACAIGPARGVSASRRHGGLCTRKTSPNRARKAIQAHSGGACITLQRLERPVGPLWAVFIAHHRGAECAEATAEAAAAHFRHKSLMPPSLQYAE